MAECNLGKVKLEPILSAEVRGGHVRGFAFMGVAPGAKISLSEWHSSFKSIKRNSFT